MMTNKHTLEAHIFWKIHSGNSSFWWYDWLGECAIAKYSTTVSSLNNIPVSYFLEGGQWNESLVRQHAPPLLVPHILNTKVQYQEGVLDEPVWKLTDGGHFSCASAWEICRNKGRKH